MRNIITVLVGLIVTMSATTPVLADSQASFKVKITKNDFDSAVFSLENAIVNRGLVVDTIGHVGAMLARTSKATGGASPYIGARYLGFCSAKLSAAAMAADPDNLAICPYIMFAYELKSEPGKARIGYRRPTGSAKPASQRASAAIEKLLADIMNEATN